MPSNLFVDENERELGNLITTKTSNIMRYVGIVKKTVQAYFAQSDALKAVSCFINIHLIWKVLERSMVFEELLQIGCYYNRRGGLL